MLVPTLPTLSTAFKANLPKPVPIAGVRVRVPFQLLPAPDKATATLVNMGAVKWRVGVVPAWASLLKVRFMVTLVGSTVWTGLAGAVTMVPVGGVVSIINAEPAGGPLKTLPNWSWAETCTA